MTSSNTSTINKTVSLAFFSAILACWILSVSALYLLFTITLELPILFFAGGLLLGGLITLPFGDSQKVRAYSFKSRVKVFIHELKHAVVIILVGGRLTGFHVYKDKESAKQTEGGFKGKTLGGKVSRVLTKRQVRFKPFISLAPYFVPLFSFPVALGVAFSWPFDALRNSALLGVALSMDSFFAYFEFRKTQSDFEKILGGRTMSSVFLVSFHTMWWLVSLVLASGIISTPNDF